ncbi:hypothetical protein CDAR_423821 [Caerostris darwini]|uniref:Uncharacterized protein n=1 Tax=Caerostris darwini TaxID=1538125 RepID=A0AAV4WB76_9ARAC|nr:hypothetical protein CDAR_423821 [Caerostris darwini]
MTSRFRTAPLRIDVLASLPAPTPVLSGSNGVIFVGASRQWDSKAASFNKDHLHIVTMLIRHVKYANLTKEFYVKLRFELFYATFIPGVANPNDPAGHFGNVS